MKVMNYTFSLSRENNLKFENLHRPRETFEIHKCIYSEEDD